MSDETNETQEGTLRYPEWSYTFRCVQQLGPCSIVERTTWRDEVYHSTCRYLIGPDGNCLGTLGPVDENPWIPPCPARDAKGEIVF